MFRRSPLAAILWLWNPKSAPRPRPEMESVPMTWVAQSVLSKITSFVAEISSLLPPEHYEALYRQFEQTGWPLPVVLERVPQTGFYHQPLRIRVAKFTNAPPFPEGLPEHILSTTTQALVRGGISPPQNNTISVPLICRVSITANVECIHKSPYPHVQTKYGLIVPIGTSYVYYEDGENHRHYASAIHFTPETAGHLLIVAPSGTGKSVLVRSIVNGLIRGAQDRPLGICYMEGKSDIASDFYSPPFVAPIECMADGSQTLYALSAVATFLRKPARRCTRH